jgi:hypothetical protein
VRMQLHSHAVPLFAMTDNSMRNEFVMRLQPGEAIYMKVRLCVWGGGRLGVGMGGRGSRLHASGGGG